VSGPPTDLRERCELLRSLHVPGAPLVLPNAWDAASARTVVDAGFPVVATTSAGVAESLGYEDHELAPREEMLAAAARIARSVAAPVTVDSEAGYGLDPGELVEALREAGAAGCNLEDTDHATGRLGDPARQVERLAALREAAASRDYPLVVNARVDVFLLAGGDADPGELLDEAVARGRSYLAAGADCVYPILLTDGRGIGAFTKAVGGSVNVIAARGAPPIADLAGLGVARVSFGPVLYREALAALAERVAGIRAS
jgi:2-methylisocitrate lyase-like PEP mutase family enzyme